MTVGQVLHASVPHHLVYQLARTNDGRASSLRRFYMCVLFVGEFLYRVFSAINPSFPMTEGRLPQFRSSSPFVFLPSCNGSAVTRRHYLYNVCICFGIFSRFAAELL